MNPMDEMQIQRMTAALAEAANDNAPRLACGLPLKLSKLVGVAEPYKAPHAPVGTPARRHKDRRLQRARDRLEYRAGMSLNRTRGQFTLAQRNQLVADMLKRTSGDASLARAA